MRTVYKVTVEANVYDDNGDFVRSETLYEGGSPRPEALLRTAPTEVEDALRDLLPDEDSEPATPYMTPDGPVAPSQPAAPKTRKRRTKAEIAADKAREEAAGNTTDPTPEPEPQAVDVPAPQVTTQPATAPVPAGPTAPAAGQAPVPATGGAPWNPFEQR